MSSYIDEQKCYEKNIQIRKDIFSWFQEYEFEWFVTMRIKTSSPGNTIENSERLLKLWKRNLCKNNHIQICYLGVIVVSWMEGFHIHLLMSGKNKYGQTLKDMDREEWEREWFKLAKKDCHIEDIYNNDGVMRYITLPKNTPSNRFELVYPSNKGLLKKCRRDNA